MKKIYYIFSLIVMAATMASCSQDVDVQSNQGYLALRIQSFVSTNTPGSRAALPEDYDARQLAVEIKDQSGAVVKSTDDFENDEAFKGNIVLTSGTYTIEAHSANWDGNASGFDAPYYFGSTAVDVKPQSLQTATIVCTQANVKLTVTYDESFVQSFQSATTTITSSLADVAPLAFVMNETTKSGYIPAGDFNLKLAVVNRSGVEHSLTRDFTDVQPRDHYILNFKLADDGILGGGDKPGISVDVDEDTKTYTYTFEVPKALCCHGGTRGQRMEQLRHAQRRGYRQVGGLQQRQPVHRVAPERCRGVDRNVRSRPDGRYRGQGERHPQGPDTGHRL